MPSFIGAALVCLVVCAVAFATVVECCSPAAAAPAAVARTWGREVFRATAKGVQKYRCEAGPDGKLAWKFVGPQADLFDGKGAKIGSHCLLETPMWRLDDGSVVHATKLRQRPSGAADAIPELELAAVRTGAGGVFADVTVVERLNTTGGVAPAIVAETKAGDAKDVEYSAEYVFYAAQ